MYELWAKKPPVTRDLPSASAAQPGGRHAEVEGLKATSWPGRLDWRKLEDGRSLAYAICNGCIGKQQKTHLVQSAIRNLFFLG